MWFIIRHGETLHNNLKISQGHFESLLTLKGITQIQSIAYRLLENETDFSKYKFITSPLVRTRQTLQIIMEILQVLDKTPIIEPLLISKNKGIFENISKEKIKKMYPEEIKKKEKDPLNYIEPEATESKIDVFKRVKKFIEKYKNENNLVIVSHRGINYLLKELLLNKTETEIINTEKTKITQNYFYMWNKKEIKQI